MKKPFLIFLLALCTGIIFFVFSQKNETKNPSVTIGGKTFAVELAHTNEKRAKGLSDREDLAESEGMLFLFDEPNYYTFWMKDMQFPIDILFINNNKIVTLHKNVPNPSPNTPLNQLPRYKPKESANMVVEIKAGLSEEYGFQEGDSVEIRGLP